MKTSHYIAHFDGGAWTTAGRGCTGSMSFARQQVASYRKNHPTLRFLIATRKVGQS